MRTVLAYVLVMPLVQFALSFGDLLVGILVALLLTRAPVSIRGPVAGMAGGLAGGALAVAFGYAVFRLVVGPDAFTVGALLASTVPLFYPIRKDIRQAREIGVVRDGLRHKQSEDPDSSVTRRLAEEAHAGLFAQVSGVVGAVVGLLVAGAWFLLRT